MLKSIAWTAMAAAAVLTASASAATRREDPASYHFKPFEFRRSLFSGNETPIGQIGLLRRDCTVPAADIRIIKAPTKGSVRFETAHETVTASKSELQKKCHGKPVDVVRIYYRANENSAGRDRVVLETDPGTGGLHRQTYLIDVERVQNATLNSGKPKPATIKPEIGINLPEERFSRSVFSGNEARLAAFNSVNADCSSGPLPDLRIVTAPAHGAYRLEETTIQIDRPPNTARASCNGKPVSAVAVHYKPTAEFVGSDDLVVDVDFRNGTVRRYIYAIGGR